ncbi:MAG TPA: DUF3108 domain-containing protein [Micropepsaceae bacterium]|nr:DUF3108 domain-containing protein [Micropepsaceae bacterium]
MKIAPFYFLGACCSGLLLAVPSFGAGGEDNPGDGVPTSTLDLSYDLYVGGIPLGKVAMSTRFDGSDYKAISSLETKGIVNAFWQAKIETAVSGSAESDRLQPTLYDSFSLNHSVQRQHATVQFGPDGPKAVTSDPPYRNSKYPVSDELKKGTLDPLSAAVYLTSGIASAGQSKPCQATAPVFDGRRRYNVVSSFVKTTDVHMDNGLYSGPAMVCEIHYNEIAGYKQSILDQNKHMPKMYAWVVSVQSNSDPNRRYSIPIRLWAETEYGVVAAVASRATLDGQQLNRPG